MWVVALARGRAQQLAALQALRDLAAAVRADRSSGVGAALARAATAGRVRFTWVDAAAQAPFCSFHLRCAGWQGPSVCDPAWLHAARTMTPAAGAPQP